MLPRVIDRSVLRLYSSVGKLNYPTSNLAFACRAYSQKSKSIYDIVVVGGGIVGTASAREILLRHPNLKIAIVEKENKLAFHQSGHNSGVIHAGIYYKPGSLKAKLCVEGLHLSYKYFDEKNIPYKKVGKLIVATNDVEVERLNDLYQRSLANNVPDVQLVDADRIKEIEPYCQGLKAIWSPHTGIVDWGSVTQYYAKDFKEAGGDVYLNFQVSKFEESKDPAYPIVVRSKNNQTVQSKYILTCGGLQSDKVAELTGCSPLPKIVPFRGEYLLLNPDKTYLVKGNIYPVPDPRFPFLGVHFTPRMDGSVWLGPNAVLAFKREGYKWSDINLIELFDALRFPGFIKMALKYVGAGMQEMLKSALIPLQVKELQKFIPEVQDYDVSRGPAGVRAQALDNDGNLVDDFVFDQGKGDNALAKNILHCRNAPSPGATSSLAIAKMIADKIETQFNIK
ncbi:L-2-hydroxyglutarate dehydrogenase, mitochondrial [Uranotaenia lowii]|uniref:L-2-hydroxyglutarate dehydrogenase, mitochondrial n=1 Tax=Uranotaenia lowii TaxID=190385 RepID=UPI00247ABBD7|nr:L-2-hydroxyglutarate dehydrogenase, mitochondrial [Uranotaenia lowii]XP_055606886.1 L-2-hydroxyglutarate dehydrogenase, mitochondrial [Uranotaenia lowii]XP_055606887.1 L-2-hydroxyglutarate dehydrogenase, mitochondrial [Uranotaenia lowii]